MERRVWISMTVVGWFVALAGACSSSTDTSSRGAGAGGSAGRGSNTSGSGAASGSGTGLGGNTSTGSSGSGGTQAGAPDPMNPAACPPAAPTNNGVCDMDGLECEYGTTDCSCESGGAAMMLNWDCETMGGNQGGQIMCPASEPMNGGTCTPGRGDCMFGTRMCDCDNDTNVWACWDPADCPATQPAEQAACTVVGMACEYEEAAGSGQGGNDSNDCDCTATGWDCGGQVCPATEPTGGGACEGGDGTCSFGGGRVCDCDSQMWACWAESDCPATPPALESACTVPGMTCPFTGGECECEDEGWDCDEEVGAAATDGGV